MNARQQKVLARFGQVLTFLDANTTSIPPTAVAGQRQSLLGAITQINGFVQDQVVKGAEALTAQTLSSARTALRDTYNRTFGKRDRKGYAQALKKVETARVLCYVLPELPTRGR